MSRSVKTIYKNAGLIVQTRHFPSSPLRGQEMNTIPTINNGFVSVNESGLISEVGSMSNYPNVQTAEVIDLNGKWIWPTWCDSHTHTVFPYFRSDEFEKRLAGISYQQIAAEGGGILNTARRLNQYSEDQLFGMASVRINNMIAKGTGAIEMKSGYGLSLESELKMLRVIKKLKTHFPIPIKATLLAAHALPQDYTHNREGYIDMICGPLLREAHEQGLVDFVDVFCETGYFSPDETRRIIKAGQSNNLPAKIHTNQFTSIGGIQVAVEENICSVDHLEVMTEKDVEQLSKSRTIATLLPIAPFFLNDPYPPGRQLIEQGAAVALATDFNPGSAPSFDMALAVSLACIKCGLTPAQAINAATVNGALAMELNDVGAISPGMRANFIVTSALERMADIPYRICSEYVEQVIINGEEWRN